MTSVRKPKARSDGEGSIFQRNSDKLWLAVVREHGKRRHVGSAKTKTAAKELLKKYFMDRQAGLKPNADKWYLLDWLDYWLQSKQPQYDAAGNQIRGVQPTTWEKYETAIRRHMKPFFGSIRLADLTAETVDRWLRDLGKHGRSAWTQHDALVVLGTALQLAEARGYVLRNVASGKQIVDRPQPPAVKHVQPSEDDLVNLLAAIFDEPLEAAVWAALGLGYRRAEVAGLQWEDITPAGDQMHVRAHRRVNRLGSRARKTLEIDGRLEREGLKSQAERSVYANASIIAVLQRRWKHQLTERLAAGTRWRGPDYRADTPSGYLFTNSVGMPLELDKIDKYLASVRKRQNLDIKRFHGLRRVFMTLLDVAGVSDRDKMELAGHKHIEMTHYYQHPMEVQKQNAARKLDTVLQRLVDRAREVRDANG